MMETVPPKTSFLRTLDIRPHFRHKNRQNPHRFAIPLIIKALDKTTLIWNTLTIKLFSLRENYARLKEAKLRGC